MDFYPMHLCPAYRQNSFPKLLIVSVEKLIPFWVKCLFYGFLSFKRLKNLLICCLCNVHTRVVTFITCCETKFWGQLVVLWQGNVLSLMNIALELRTFLSSSKKYCGKKVFGSEGKNTKPYSAPSRLFLTIWKSNNNKY